MGDVSCRRDHDVARPVFSGPEGAQISLGKAADTLFATGNLATQWRVAEHRQIEECVDVLARVIQIRADLLNDDRPLRLDLAAAQVWPDYQFAQHVHAAHHFTLGDPDPVDGGLTIRGG